MSRISRQILAGALALIFLGSGCGVISRSNPTPVWTVPPGGPPVLPTTTVVNPAMPTNTAVTPAIPITGENLVAMQCQFCVDDETHVMLVFPAFASFDVVASSPVTCLTADMVNDQRVVICRGVPSTTFNLKVCAQSSSCLEFPIALQPCPILQAGSTPLTTQTPLATVFLTPINTLEAPTEASTQAPSTPTPTPESAPVTPVTPPTSYP